MDIQEKKISGVCLEGERSLFGNCGIDVSHTIFQNGESPLKECRDVKLQNTMFKWKYPLWYSKDVEADDCTWFDMARAGVWYTEGTRVKNAVIQAPKNFRRCHKLSMENVFIPNAAETLWHCDDVRMDHVQAQGDYFAMNSSHMTISDFELIGNYSFDGVKDVEIRRARLLSKDAFWNSENVTVCDSFVSGEYLGWNAKNLTLINCTIESLQGLCYIENLVMKQCRLLHTTLAFEYSTVDVQVEGHVDSILNPKSGTICADSIGELIMDPRYVDPAQTRITCERIEKRHFASAAGWEG